MGVGWGGEILSSPANPQTSDCSELDDAVIESSQCLILGKLKKIFKRSKTAQSQNRHHSTLSTTKTGLKTAASLNFAKRFPKG